MLQRILIVAVRKKYNDALIDPKVRMPILTPSPRVGAARRLLCLLSQAMDAGSSPA